MDEDLPPDLGRRLGELDDLPDELKRQLQAAKIGELEQDVISVIRETYGGVANVDEILVGLFRRRGKVYQRQYLANKLYRMVTAKQIVSVPKKRGVYRVM